jgi:hypothetical protein
VSTDALEKVLRLAQPAAVVPEASDFIREAAEDLDRLALLLAQQAEDDDEDDEQGDGDDDSSDEDDDEDDDAPPKGKKKPKAGRGGNVPPWLKNKAGKGGPPSKGSGKKQKIQASRQLVLEAMVALSQVQGGEVVSLSVLTAAERKKPSAHTIPGSDDYPIPDKAHLGAAKARYRQGKLAGHSDSEVRNHINRQAKRLGEPGLDDEDSEKVAASALLTLARGGGHGQEVAMDHAPFTGEHDHPHRVVNVHSHKHTHNGDSRHACGDSRSMGDW